MSRTQLYLAGLLLVQVVLILVFRSPFSGASASYESRALLPSLDAITASRIEIVGPDDDSIDLLRRDGTWRVEGLGGFPADGEKIEQLLESLADIRVRRPVVTSSRYQAAFKVGADDNEARIRLWDSDDGEPAIDLIVGSSPNFRSSYVRLAGEDAVYEARGVSPYEIRPTGSTWIDRDLVDVDASRVVGFKLTRPSGSLELSKVDGAWQLAAGTADASADLDQEKIDAFVRDAVDLRLSDGAGPVDEALHGFAKPAATLVLRLQDAAPDAGAEASTHELTIRIGAKPADNESQRYVTREGSGFTGTIWESSVRRLLEETVEDLRRS